MGKVIPFGAVVRQQPVVSDVQPKEDMPKEDMSPMRVMLSLVCGHCQNAWLAPTKGNCPICHSESTEQVLARVNALKRL